MDFTSQFCVDYKRPNSPVPVRDILKTAERYAKNEMIYDLIPLLPLQLIHHKYSRLYFLIKCLRVKKSMNLLSTAEFMRFIHVIYERRLVAACADEDLAEDQNQDNTGIMAQIWIKNFF